MHKTRRHRISKHKKRYTRRKYKQKRKNTSRKGVKKRNNTRKKKHGGAGAESAMAAVAMPAEVVAKTQDTAQARIKELGWWDKDDTKNAIEILKNIAPSHDVEAPHAASDDKFTINIVPSLREHGKGVPLGTSCDPGRADPRNWEHNSNDDILYEANNCAGYITDGPVVKAQRDISSEDSQVKWINRMNGDDGTARNYLAPKWFTADVEDKKLSYFKFVLKNNMPMPRVIRRNFLDGRDAIIRRDLLSEVFESDQVNFIFVGHHNNMKAALFPDLGKKIALGNCCCIEVKLDKSNSVSPVEIKVIYSGETEKYDTLLGDTHKDIINKLTKTWTKSLKAFSTTSFSTKKLYFIRHGQTLHNLADGERCTMHRKIKKAKFIDNPLTYKGQLQAVKCGVELDNSNVFDGFTKENTKLYTSILTRTTDTLFLILYTIAFLKNNPSPPPAGATDSLWNNTYLKWYQNIVYKRLFFNRERLKRLLEINDDDYNQAISDAVCQILPPLRVAAPAEAAPEAAPAAPAEAAPAEAAPPAAEAAPPARAADKAGGGGGGGEGGGGSGGG